MTFDEGSFLARGLAIRAFQGAVLLLALALGAGARGVPARAS